MPTEYVNTAIKLFPSTVHSREEACLLVTLLAIAFAAFALIAVTVRLSIYRLMGQVNVNQQDNKWQNVKHYNTANDRLWKQLEEKRLIKNAEDEEKNVALSKICEQVISVYKYCANFISFSAKMFKDMADSMRKVVKLCASQNKDLSVLERDLLFTAYQNGLKSKWLGGVAFHLLTTISL
uniref:Uncharacterized protein n=1 Tax=Ditylenchus dipsaci TaxID=166011 RepID=A0A915ENA1_9BILA